LNSASYTPQSVDNNSKMVALLCCQELYGASVSKVLPRVVLCCCE
jgi:hypothetical protein